jgi:hypothetical protein
MSPNRGWKGPQARVFGIRAANPRPDRVRKLPHILSGDAAWKATRCGIILEARFSRDLAGRSDFVFLSYQFDSDMIRELGLVFSRPTKWFFHFRSFRCRDGSVMEVALPAADTPGGFVSCYSMGIGRCIRSIIDDRRQTPTKTVCKRHRRYTLKMRRRVQRMGVPYECFDV